MKVVAINGSAPKDGNTALLVRNVFEELEKANIETELIQLAGKRIQGCTACAGCFKAKSKKCVVNNPAINECIEKMIEADGIILASPVYFANMTSEMKALIDCAGMVARANDNMFSKKIGAAVVAGRRAGFVHTFDSINHFFLISQMVVCGSSYWNLGVGREVGEVSDDKEGMHTMQTLGENMAWLLGKTVG